MTQLLLKKLQIQHFDEKSGISRLKVSLNDKGSHYIWETIRMHN